MEKKWYLSKTIYVNLIMAICAFIPVIKDNVSSYPEIAGVIVAVVNFILRLSTKDKISFWS